MRKAIIAIAVMMFAVISSSATAQIRMGTTEDGKPIYNASKFGIRSDGVTMNTRSIQKGIDWISDHGGGVVWRYQDPAHHHDAQWLPNGHLLYAACAPVPPGFAERVPGGTAHGPDEVMYADVIREVDRSGRLVWEWKAWEHLDPEDFPIHPGFGRYHWPLVNGLAVAGDGSVLMSLRTSMRRSPFPTATS